MSGDTDDWQASETPAFHTIPCQTCGGRGTEHVWMDNMPGEDWCHKCWGAGQDHIPAHVPGEAHS